MGQTVKKNMAIVFGITDNYSFALCNVLLGMKKHHKKPFWDDIIVLHDGVTVDNQKIANAILPCRFIKIEDKEWLMRLRSNLDEKTLKMYSVATMFRYYCFDLLDEYHKLFWPDCDILIQGDFSGILKYGDKSGYAACLSDGLIPIELSFKELIPGYSMFMPNYNAGTLVLTDKLPHYKEYCQWCKNKTIELATKLDMPDQGILNLLIQEYNIQPEIIDAYAFQCHPLMPQAMDRYSAPIVHAYGTRKFWNDAEYQRMFPEWVELNQKYLEIAENVLHHRVDNKASVPLVSVVMSTYTRIEFLKEAVESILNQTYPNIELLVVVEKSEKQDETVAMLEAFSDKRIRVICNKEKIGFAASLNIGLDEAKGEFIARMDDDDISLPERIEKEVEYLKNNPDVDIVGTHVQTFMHCNDKWNRYPSDYEYARIELLRGTVVCHPTVMMRLNKLNQYNLRYNPDVFTEDYDLWARAIEHLNISNIPEILYKYRASSQNITVKSPAAIHYSHLNVMRYQFKHYLNLDPTLDEINLMNGRIDIIEKTYTKHKKQAEEILSSFRKKIVEANREAKFYNQEKLEIYFGVSTSKASKAAVEVNKQKAKKRLKTILKGVIRPISDRVVWTFSRRTYDMINRRADGIINKLNELPLNLPNRVDDPMSERIEEVNQLIIKKTEATEIKVLASLERIHTVIQEINQNYINLIGAISESQIYLEHQISIKADNILSQENIASQNVSKAIKNIENHIVQVFNDASLSTKKFDQNSISLFEEAQKNLYSRINEIEESINTHALWNLSDVQKSLFYLRFLLEKKLGYFDSISIPSTIYIDEFYMDNMYHSFISARIVLGKLIHLIPVASCIDIGCGCGAWLYAARRLGVNTVRGIDGDYVNRSLLLIGNEEFIAHDITKEYRSEIQFDLSICVEVAEHIPEEKSNVLINTLCNLSKIILFSSAHPGQGGDGHINEKPYSYWVKMFKHYGYEAYDIRPLFYGNEQICEWYRENICLYVDKFTSIPDELKIMKFKE